MSTRLISGIALLEGLLLVGLSLLEIRRVHQACRDLNAARQLSATLSERLAKNDTLRGQRMLPDVLEVPEDNVVRETPWWIVSGIGGGWAIVGAVGLLGARKASRLSNVSPAPALNRRFHFSSNTLSEIGGFNNSRPVLYLLLFGMSIVVVCWRISEEHGFGSTPRPIPTTVPYLISKLPRFFQTIAYHWYCGAVAGVSFVKVPYNPSAGPWISLEEAIVQFADSNKLEIVHFENAGSKEAYVCVRDTDASSIRKFVRSMIQGANRTGSANGSQPVSSGTNQASAATDSRR